VVTNRAAHSRAAGISVLCVLFLAGPAFLAFPDAGCDCGCVLGLGIRALASGHVRKNESLATSGPYAYTRNPLYLGSLLIGLGFSLAAGSWWVVAALVVMFFAVYLPVIRNEEAFLRRTFPEFDEYARLVPRMFPRLPPHARDEKEASAGFSLQLYLKHREYNALLGALAMMGGLIFKITMLRS
jgi:hypothetical protein